MGSARGRLSFAVWLVPVLCSAGIAVAQVPQPQDEAQQAGRTRSTTRDRLDAAQEAALFVPLDGRRATYAEVIASPDDIELSFRYALTQVDEGNLTGASSTLERILLLQSDLAQVRLLYGVVLYRLGNLTEADRELVRVANTPAGAQYQAQIDAYRAQIRRARQVTRQTLSLTAGTQHDTNRNSGPDSDQVKLGDTIFALGDDAEKQSDGGWFSLADLQIERDFGLQEDRQLVIGASYFHSQQADLDSFDVQAVHLETGVRRRRAGAEIHPRLVADIVDLSRESYLRSFGVEMGGQRPLSASLSLRGRIRTVHEDFDGIPEATTASERSGFRSDLGATLAFVPSAGRRLEAALTLTHKSAKESHQAYVGAETALSHLWVFGRGQFLLANVSVASDLYRDDLASVSRTKRRDVRSRGRLVYGAPIFAWVDSPRFASLRDIVLSVSGELSISGSNLPNYEYRNRKVGVALSRRIEF